MIVIYRMSANISEHEARRPRYAYDRLKLADMCLRSFVEAFEEVSPKIYFILDKCGREWDEMIKKNVPFEFEIEHVEWGTYFKTIPYQFEIAKNMNDYVLFQEDDYVWLKDTGKKFEEAMKVLEFVSPYDHGEFYTRNQVFHKPPFDIRLVVDHHWRTEDFNTMTWGCHSSNIEKYWKPLSSNGWWDMNTQVAMGKEGARFWSPIPGMAVHMHKDFLSPSVDWSRRFDELDK